MFHLEYGIFHGIPRNIPWNMKIQKMEYSKKYGKHVKTQLFWYMEYSRNIPKIGLNKNILYFFGIWNIPEYSKKNLSQEKVLTFWNIFCLQQVFFALIGIWNIPIFTLNKIFVCFLEYGIFHILPSTGFFTIFLEYGIFQEYSKKIVKHAKFPKFWNMEYSMEYSWNIPKNIKHAAGA